MRADRPVTGTEDFETQRGAGDSGYSLGSVYISFVGVLVLLLGLVLGAGGVWLISLGGSWYYAIAGLGLIASGYLLLRQEIIGVGIYFLIWIGTLIWALWEVGFQPWPLVPRVVAPTIILVLVALTIPIFSSRAASHKYIARHGKAYQPLAVLLAVGLAFSAFAAERASAQSEAPQAVEPAQADDAPAGEAAPTDEAVAPAAAQADPAPGDVPAAVVEPARGTSVLHPAQTLEAGTDWPAYGGTHEGQRYSPLNQITRDNVSDLEQVWEFRSGDMPTGDAEGKYSPENTPLKVGDSLFICTAMNIMVAIDAATGKEEWRYDPGVSADAIPYGATCRGVAHYANPDAEAGALCAERVIETTLDARMIAVDAATGQLCADFGQNGIVDLNEGIGSTVPGWYAVSGPPTIVRGIAVTGAQVKDGQAEDAPSGVIRGYDAVTGELAWAWDMGKPGLKGLPPEGEVYTRGTPNMWTLASGDEELGLVYLPMGNSSVDYYGGNRSEAENEFSTSVVAVDVETGDVVWKFQTVHYDVWDYDLGSQPTLIDFPGENGPVAAMILPSKQGPIFILDRQTGEPLFPVEERDVPTGGVEPENLSPTQPYSTYATLSQPPLTERDMWGMSPLDQLWCRIQFRRAAYDGEYTPPTADRRWIQYPGYNGGNDWGGIAVDVERGILIANYNDMPNYNRLIPREEADEQGIKPIIEGGEGGGGEAGAQAGSPYAIAVNAGWRMPTGLLCKQPPYGGIRAIDLATGETLWDQPIGTARKNGPFGIPSMLPFNIGTPNNGGPLVTAGGLIFIAAATDDLLRAIDIETGDVVWQTVLPAGGQATPMTYEVDGRQYLVIAPGGHHFMETPIGDYVIAYALPDRQ
ncbi:membrane-bound PQQ-dependent dehydrogenase, glucose/quinate/shikimate family [Hoeflea sp.]|uniref:membrane-bound PQQ-dependent dehydrogenase, glucose/quinate/shikimate family n=1 Tax=Hoeflea sp. TaxID=1940281 RepID=UPI0019CED3FA|nr:membrane-bound PQQ-dependent dehydrogenase, glucose/quinate/shikimate family [Hoeflea sp.]MBC7282000.1 membrane-bound PQQ-dependent dehydrogenase, glucose/quinate/shikimate family [Hoeflea sp.]